MDLGTVEIEKTGKITGVFKYLKSRRALFAIIGFFLVFVGIFILIRVVFVASPISNKLPDDTWLANNAPNKGFSEKILPLSSNKELKISDSGKDFFASDKKKYLLARTPVGSYIYEVVGASISTYFSSSKDILTARVLPSGAVFFTSRIGAREQLWSLDENKNSVMIYESGANEEIITYIYDKSRNQILLLVNLPNKIFQIIRVAIGLESQIIATTGNISRGAEFVGFEQNEFWLYDGEICTSFLLIELSFSQVDCKNFKINSVQEKFKFSPSVALAYDANDGSSIDRYLETSKSFVRVLNEDRGFILFPLAFSKTRLLVARSEFVQNTFNNTYIPSFKTLSFYNIEQKNITTLTTELPGSMNDTSNIRFFFSGEEVFAIDLLSSPKKLYRFDPNFTPTPVPAPISSPTSFPISYSIVDVSKWRSVSGLAENVMEYQLLDQEYFVK